MPTNINAPNKLRNENKSNSTIMLTYVCMCAHNRAPPIPTPTRLQAFKGKLSLSAAETGNYNGFLTLSNTRSSRMLSSRMKKLPFGSVPVCVCVCVGVAFESLIN